MVVSPRGGGMQSGSGGPKPFHVHWPDVLLTAAFSVLFLIQLMHHAMWRDELNVFGIVRASPSLSSLFWHIHHEGHPWLWYFLVWIASWFTASPVAMKVLEAGIVIATYCVIGLGSPFSRLEKTLLFLNYFIAFEYTVVSRMYSVLLLLALLYARERSLRPERALRLGLLLGLMSCADNFGMILAAALAAEYAVYLFLNRGVAFVWKPQYSRGALAYILLTVLAVWSAKTAPDISWRTTGHIFSFAKDTRHLSNGILSYTVMPYFPVQFGRGDRMSLWWNPFPEGKRAFFAVCFVALMVAYWCIFRRYSSWLIFLLIVLFAASAFGHLIFMGSMRHYGVTFMAFVIALWVVRGQSRKMPRLALGLLAMGAFGGIYVEFALWRHPFSNLETAASWLTSNGYRNTPFTGVPDTSTSLFAVLLNRPVYMLECHCTDTYLLFSKRRDDYQDWQMPDRLVGAMRYYQGQPLVFADVVPLTQEQEEAIHRRGLNSREIARFTDAIAERENFYLYRISPSSELP